MKKGSNPSPPIVSINMKRVAMIFDEWQKRYTENPSKFEKILDEKGEPVTGYGECCAIYFKKLASELN